MSACKKPCIRCGRLLEDDARFCGGCGSRSPFFDSCPSCLREVKRQDALCSACGRALRVACPACGAMTFVQEACEACGAGLMKQCTNKRCGQWQFFENKKCTACGKPLK